MQNLLSRTKDTGAWTIASAMALGLWGCGNSTSSGTDMLPSDMTMHAADMAPPMLTGLPTNCTAGATADQVYSMVVSPTCAISDCHGSTNSVYWSAGTSSAQMKTALVGVASTEAGQMDRIKASDLNNSYLMYKLVNQQSRVATSANAGVQMPDGEAMLSQTDLCLFISWIQGGAN